MKDSHAHPAQPRLDWWDALLGTGCLALALTLYVRTLTPGLLGGDSGEFQTLAYLLGHTHPTGYPVYLVLAKLAIFWPWGDVAYRVNLFSALMGALTVLGVYLCGRLLVKQRILSFVAALGLAVSPTFWSQAIIAEVYTPGSAFLVFMLLALLWWHRSDSARALFLAGLLGGLSLGVHMSVALMAPAVLLFMLMHWRRGRRMWIAALMGALAGVLITVLIFWLIDLHNPPANYFNAIIYPSRSSWGLSAAQIDGPLERLGFDWSARQFRTFMFADPARVMPLQADAFWENLHHELGWPLICLAFLGVVDLLFRSRRVGVLLLIGLLTQLVCIFNYAIWDVYVFFIPSYVLLVLLAIVGMGALVDVGKAILGRFRRWHATRGVELALAGALALLLLGFSVWPVFKPRSEAFLHAEIPFAFDEYPAYSELLLDAARAMVVELPQGALVFTEWDMVWPYYYAAHIVQGRMDLLFIETRPADDIEGIASSLIDYISDNLDGHVILFQEREQALLEAGFSLKAVRFGPMRFYQVRGE
jgi:4-amino-4-deoxy-L-arabinose transferase-like glycosyltransferase